jgi:hypothetical protein
MRTYREILNFLLVREQSSLGWKISFFIVCGALVYGAITVGHIRVRSVDVLATVVEDRAGANFNAPASYLTVKLDNGEIIRVNAAKGVDYRPGSRVLVKQTTTNFFGVRKHEFKRYVEEPRRD